MGCGTGVLLEALGRHLGSVGGSLPGVRLAGVDLSPGMLAVARERLGSGASLVAGDVARLPFRSASFDVALSANALHHWPDQKAALGEIHRVVAPGGRIAITDWCADFPLDRIRSWIRRRAESIHIRAYRAAELKAMLAGAGFGDIRVERWRLGWRWGLMTATATRAR